MKKYFLLILSCSALLMMMAAGKPEDHASALLRLTAKRLGGLELMSYTYKREINNYKDNYFNKTAAVCFFDFRQDRGVVSMFRFQLKSESYTQIFNGSEYFELGHKDKSLAVTERPASKTFSNLSCFYNSIPTLRNMLNTVASDDSVARSLKDTIADGIDCQLIRLSMHNKAMDYFTGYRRFKINIMLYYDILINRKSGLPYQVTESNSVDGKQYNTKVTFLNIDTAPRTPAETSWYYSSYQKEYHPVNKIITKPLISVGSEMDAWILPVIKQNRKVTRDDFKGKIVMMDFWIKNCGYCMESFPYLRSLQEKYGKAKFQLLAVNAYDSEKDVEFFYRREKPGYLMVYNGEELAGKLGIQGYPQVVIMGTNGKVIYAGSFDKEVVDSLLAKLILPAG